MVPLGVVFLREDLGNGSGNDLSQKGGQVIVFYFSGRLYDGGLRLRAARHEITLLGLISRVKSKNFSDSATHLSYKKRKKERRKEGKKERQTDRQTG